ncbi:Ribonuclease HII [bacterium HR14]|nr:Ribonuclease HII [bacterium HR14]
MKGRLIAGVDEAGRGPIAGPVVAGCVLLREPLRLEGVRDSKTLSESAREHLFRQIQQVAVAWSVGVASPREIERLNILQASLLAMRRALLALPVNPHKVFVDGKFPVPDYPISQEAIVDGDALHPAISAASIVAKVVRDRLMRDIDPLYPAYGFAQHKGYPTPAHLQSLAVYGACSQHRRTYAPVLQLCFEWGKEG